MRLRLLLPIAAIAFLAACAGAPKIETPSAPSPSASSAPSKPAPRPSSKYYLDDGPGDQTPADLDAIPDAVPRIEALHRFANRPYVVFGREYVPATSLRAYRERGVASWYGRKFHGQKTSAGETYDMYAMTAAHPTLPLPSYARVTGVASGRSVVVRVNDRGPFLHDRVIDLSYAAAHQIGIAQKGSGEVVVEAILPGDPDHRGARPAAAAGRHGAAGGGAARRAVVGAAVAGPGRAGGGRSSSSSSARSPISTTRRTSWRCCEFQLAGIGVERAREIRQAAGHLPRVRRSVPDA